MTAATDKWIEENRKQKIITPVILKNPIRTGMALALGFFLMSIVLVVVGVWIVVGAAVLSQ